MAYNDRAWEIAKRHIDKLGGGHYIGLTGPCCDHCRTVYNAVVETMWVSPVADDPVMDGTDFAHPAWWRGHEYSFTRSCKEINDILDGTKANVGTSVQPWQQLRQRLYDIRAMLGIAERVVFSLPKCLNRSQWYSIRGKYCKGVERTANEHIQGDPGDEHKEYPWS